MFRRRSRPLTKRPSLRERQPGTFGLGKREVARRLAGLGLNRHDDELVRREGLAIVARFLRWVADQPCAVSGKRTGDVLLRGDVPWGVVVHAAHVISRGALAGDFGNVIALADWLHQDSHRDPTFWARHARDPYVIATATTLQYLADHSADARWLLTTAVDGDVLALANAALGGRAGGREGPA